MKNLMFVLSLSLIVFTNACNVLINPTHTNIIVLQGSNVIQNEVGYYNFDETVIDLSHRVTFTIKNEDVDDLVLKSDFIVELFGNDAMEFLVDTSKTDSVIQSYSSTTFDIVFTPTKLGRKKTKVLIPNNDRDKDPFTFLIIGVCVPGEPEIAVKQDDTDILNHTGVYDFGNVNVKESSQNIKFTIYNNGSNLLFLNGIPNKIAITGKDYSMFEINQVGTSDQIDAGETTTFEVCFKPTQPGIKIATIQILNNDTDQNPYVFTLTGTAIAAPEIQIRQGADIIENIVGEYDFGVVLINETPEVTFIIENLGTSVLHLSGSTTLVEISGTNYDSFIVNTGSTSEFIQPGDFTTFSLKFATKIEGSISAIIKIPNNDSDENPYEFGIKAYGLMYDWTKVFNGSGCVRVETVITDSNNNVYIAGDFSGTVNFAGDFGGSDNKTSKGRDYDGFIVKINANGSYGWSKQFWAEHMFYIASLQVDRYDNVYMVGIFGGNSNFGADFGVTDTKTSIGHIGFVTKISSTGTYIGTKVLGQTGMFNDLAFTLDSSDNIYISGYFRNTVNFGYDFGIQDVKTSATNGDTYLTKIDTNFNYKWTRVFNNTNCEHNYGIKTDSYGNVYIACNYADIVNFGMDFGVTDVKTCAGIFDCCLIKINSNGTYGWSRVFGNSEYNKITSIAITSTNEIYLVGFFSSTIDFASDFGATDAITSSGQKDVFLMKVHSDGTYGWTKKFGGTAIDMSYGITTDQSDNVFVVGYFGATVNFGASFGESDSKTASSSDYPYGDAFIVKINSNDTYAWAKKIGGDEQCHATDVHTDTNNNIFIVGSFSGKVDFGADFYTSESESCNLCLDGYLMKLVQ